MIYRVMGKIEYTIAGQKGKWHLDSTYISELGFLMARFQNTTEILFFTINLGEFSKLIGADKKY
jgi:hypothetical protein